MTSPLTTYSTLARILFQERDGFFDVARLAIRWRRLAQPPHPRGNGEPVMVLPGFLTDDWSTHLLRRHLSRLGYTVSGWGLGTNHGKLATLLPQAHAAIAALHAQSGKPVRLIGWSLGGVIAREVARRSPAHVDRVITMGSPLRGPQHTAFSAIFPTRDDRRLAERDRAQPIQVPILTLYSQRDAVVFVEGAIDNSSPAVHNHQVDCTHLGFVLSPDVYAMLAQLLQQDCSEM